MNKENLTIFKTIDVLGNRKYQLDMYGSLEETYFLALEVARMLDYNVGDTSKMLNMVAPQDKQTRTIFRAGQNREVWFVNESGLYDILMLSRKPVAQRFKNAVKDILHDLRIKGEQDFEDWLNFGDPLVEEWEALTMMREEKSLDEISWEDFLRIKGYTDEMLSDI